MRLPVDPIVIANKLGIKVFKAGLADGVSGLLVKRVGRDPEIYVNVKDSDNRQRFTVAHELGHYVKRSSSGDETWEYVDPRGSLASKGSDPDEIYANQFAASLLMPRSMVEQLRQTHTTSLAYKFGVSEDAMNFA